MGRSRDIAGILGKSEAENANNLAFLNTSSPTGVDSAQVQNIGLQSFDTVDSLPISNLEAGQQAYVTGTNRLYISNGSGWYNTTLVNRNPRWDSGGEPDAEYEIADSATPLVIIAKAVDSDNSDINLLNQSFGTDSAQYMATITNDSSVFTFTPKSADSIGIEVAAGNLTDSNGDFTYTFKWSDGISFISKAATISYNPGAAAALYEFTSHTFTSGSSRNSRNDNIGPTLSNLTSAYSSTTWASDTNYLTVPANNQGVQRWTVPKTGNYSWTLLGGGGGSNNSSRNRSGQTTFDVDLVAGDILDIIVGQRGNDVFFDGSGGGASFVGYSDATSSNYTTRVLGIAGGGGGGRGQTSYPTSTTAQNGGGSNPGTAGTNGNGGGGSPSNGPGGGGAGLIGYGSSSDNANNSAYPLLASSNRGLGGATQQQPALSGYWGFGGFGGGGCGTVNNLDASGIYSRPGAGGGFNGGGAGSYHANTTSNAYGGYGSSYLGTTVTNGSYGLGRNSGVDGYVSVTFNG